MDSILGMYANSWVGVLASSRSTMVRSQPMLAHADVLAALDAIRRDVEARGKPAAIAICDAHGELLAFVRCDGALLGSGTLAINKAFTAARLDRPTRVLGETLRAKGADVAFYGDPRYVGFGGGLPVRIDGRVAGGVAVSGLSDDEDEALAGLGVAMLERRAAPVPGA